MTTRQIVTTVHSGNIDLIMTSIVRKPKSSEKLEQIQFTQIWVVVRHNFKNAQHFFAECQEEQTSYCTIFKNNKKFDVLFIQKSP